MSNRIQMAPACPGRQIHLPAIRSGFVLCALLGLIGSGAMAADKAPASPMRDGIIYARTGTPVRPLYTPQCEYKPVMNNEEMRRCGVFYYSSNPAPVLQVIRVDRPNRR